MMEQLIILLSSSSTHIGVNETLAGSVLAEKVVGAIL